MNINFKKKYTIFQDYNAEFTIFIKRIIISLIIIVILLSILIINLYNLQILHYEVYKTRSNNNRIKLIQITPTRGIIYDRNGIPLALNRIFYQLEVIPNKITTDLEIIFNQLRKIVNLTDDEILIFKKKYKKSHNFTSIPLKLSLNEVQLARFVVNKYRFLGIIIKRYQRRYYPYGAILTHVLGYVAKINNNDIQYLENRGLLNNYNINYYIGKLGIERYYENKLHGKVGYKEVEVNSKGQIIRLLHTYPPEAGKNIYLTINLHLQIKLNQLLTKSKAGVVITDPRNGEILALLSTPSYDPNVFVHGISDKYYQILSNNYNNKFINRAIQGIYPPASTVKPFIAIAALGENFITANSTIFDPGWWKLPYSNKRYRDWKPNGHGQLNVVKAIIESADTFFYQLSYNMGIDRITKWMQKFGFGNITGIDLMEERSGIMPTRKWKKEKYKQPWYPGDTIPVGIGQGYWTTTPIQMAKALMILINNGVVKIPHLLYYIKNNNSIIPYKQKKDIQIYNIYSGIWELVKKGMYGVANAKNGTAYKNFINTSYKAAVKSGTAQLFSYKTYNIKQLSENLHDHKLMIGFAPYKNPVISLVIILENGKSDLTVGKFVRKIFDFVLVKN